MKLKLEGVRRSTKPIRPYGLLPHLQGLGTKSSFLQLANVAKGKDVKSDL